MSEGESLYSDDIIERTLKELERMLKHVSERMDHAEALSTKDIEKLASILTKISRSIDTLYKTDVQIKEIYKRISEMETYMKEKG